MIIIYDAMANTIRTIKALTFLTSVSLRAGGPSRSVPSLVKGLSEIGVDITLMTVRSDDMNTDALENSSAKLKVLESGYTQQELEVFLSTERFDIIQVQSIWDLRYHKLKNLADKYHIPFIITPRGMLEPWSLSQKKWKKKLALLLYQMRDLNTCACVFATAEMEALHIRELGVKAPISVIPNGIETEGYACRTSPNEVKKQVLFLSRIHVKKGIELLIDVWKNLHKDFSDWQLLIVGNGEKDYIDTLNEKVIDNGLDNCINILPPVFGSAKYKLYCESSLFVLPSYSENFGMVIAEALSCGVPVITTTDTPWKLLNGEKNSTREKLGWCIDLSVDNLEIALREAMSMDSQELFEMGQKGSRMIYHNFDYRNVACKTKDLYEWVLRMRAKPYFIYE